jgi:hypothetical protein
MSDYSVSQFPSREPAGPVTCAACGCRLVGLTGLLDGAYRHFPALKSGHDARGCRPACVDALHDHAGRPLASSVADATSTLDSAAA